MTSEFLAVPKDLVSELLGTNPLWFRRAVSGTYRNAAPAGSGRIIELRVDVDGNRPQNRLSGDVFFHFSFLGIDITLYLESFVVESPVVGGTAQELTISGPVAVYGQPGRVNEVIEVHIPRVLIFADPPPACVNWLVGGTTTAIYACPKISEHFRTATLEIDRFQGTVFPSELNPTIAPSPSGLPAMVGVRSVFDQSGIDLDVVLDDVLNDPDSPDPGDNWSEVELHDLMETRFDSFQNVLQWRLYGVVVPRFGDPDYDSGYFGVMFDWGAISPATPSSARVARSPRRRSGTARSARSTTPRPRRSGCSSRRSSTRSATPGTSPTPGGAPPPRAPRPRRS